jgi:uncharacterized protein (TIGR03437 family)
MKRITILFGFLLMTATAFAQTPVAGGVVNAASYAFAGLPNAGIAQGSLFIVFGSNIGPTTLVRVASFPLTPTLVGTSISITVSGTTTQALMIYTSAGQVAAVLPSKTPVGTGNLTVTYNGQSSAPLAITVVQSNLGIFTLNQGGSGAAVILDGDNVPITALHPAAPNQTVVLYGTGLGPYSGDETQAAITTDMTSIPVEVYVGTVKANVSFRGRNSCCVGLDQINFQVPPGQLGCNVSVAVKIGSLVSNFTTMAVASGGACSDANGISSTTLQQLSSRGNVAFGSVALSRSTIQITLPPPLPSQAITSETGGAVFARYSRDAFLQSAGSFSSISVGGCSVFTFRGSSATAALGTFTALDAGAAITVNGPNGSKQMTKSTQVAGTYSATFGGVGQPPYLTTGSYSISGPGGADVGVFQASLTAGASLNWTNQSSITTVNRSQDLNITWTGGGTGLVTIAGTSIAGTGDAAIGAVFTCTAPASQGQFTVPAIVLLALPVSSTQSAGGISIPTGFLLVGSQTTSSFTASGIDQGFAIYSDSAGKGVGFQ